MREIKFRYLYPTGEHGKYQTFYFTLEQIERGEIPSEIPEHRSQFTGLKDSKGVEIYEGDIVTTTDIPQLPAKTTVVKWESAGFNLTSAGDLVVIGNIMTKPTKTSWEKGLELLLIGVCLAPNPDWTPVYDFVRQVRQEAIRETIEAVKMGRNPGHIVGLKDKVIIKGKKCEAYVEGVIDGYNQSVSDLEAKIAELKKKKGIE
jgi:hypothetical protein